MNYEEAYNFIFYEIGHEGSTLLMYIAEDRMMEAIELIKKLTNCSNNDAKAIWVDLKSEYGTEETNPFLQSCTISPQQQAHNNAVAQEWLNKPRCPYCNSTNVKNISDTERVVSVAMLGLFSKKINKSFKCNNCGGTF